mmetsp:Transcript_54106/g.150461  ORF Transcript_54106/g.150461 Transcript_54106/m.150461 type:complete len:328 (-) Transcript_54106:576-1559(-)
MLGLGGSRLHFSDSRLFRVVELRRHVFQNGFGGLAGSCDSNEHVGDSLRDLRQHVSQDLLVALLCLLLLLFGIRLPLGLLLSERFLFCLRIFRDSLRCLRSLGFRRARLRSLASLRQAFPLVLPLTLLAFRCGSCLRRRHKLRVRGLAASSAAAFPPKGRELLDDTRQHRPKACGELSERVHILGGCTSRPGGRGLLVELPLHVERFLLLRLEGNLSALGRWPPRRHVGIRQNPLACRLQLNDAGSEALNAARSLLGAGRDLSRSRACWRDVEHVKPSRPPWGYLPAPSGRLLSVGLVPRQKLAAAELGPEPPAAVSGAVPLVPVVQ